MDDIPGEYHHLFTDEYLGDRHIFRASAHNPEVLETRTCCRPARRATQRVGYFRGRRGLGARYEWHQHVDIARDTGVTIAEMRAIGGGELSVFDDAEYVLLQYARAIESGTVADQIHDAFTRHDSSGEVVAVGLLVDFYVGLCNYIASVDLPFEGGEFVGWVPEEETVSELFE